MPDNFTIKDSGVREEFKSGMVRDTTAGKINFLKVLDGPMLERWAAHLTKGAVKYPDVKPGVANWTLADGEAELQRAKESAIRHFFQYLRGDTDEDHASAVFFNINLAEYVKDKLRYKPYVDFANSLTKKHCIRSTEYYDGCDNCRAANA